MDAVILAAGYSSRTPTYKMALQINGLSVLSHIIETLYPICEKLIVVGGYYYEVTKPLVSQYAKVKLIINEQYTLGMFSSIKVGVRETKGDFFVIPGDYPMILKATCEHMKNHFQKSQQKGHDILIPTYNQKRGHPVLLSKRLKEPLLAEEDVSNLRVFQDRYCVDYLEVKDRGILMDIDTMKDYHQLVQLMEERCARED